jgi:hypothetical protein
MSVSYTDDDGKRWLDLTSSLRALDGTVSLLTLATWARQKKTSWGLSLDVRRHDDARGKRRLVVSERSVEALKDSLPQRANAARKTPKRKGPDLT